MNNSFLNEAFIYLAAAVVFVPIAKQLGMGSVLGYLLGGIIIGPFFLGFVGEEGKDIMHFAEFGVVMMLFLIGLELEPAGLWKMRKLIVGMGTIDRYEKGRRSGVCVLRGVGPAGKSWRSPPAYASIRAQHWSRVLQVLPLSRSQDDCRSRPRAIFRNSVSLCPRNGDGK